jgi:hypothetical protein
MRKGRTPMALWNVSPLIDSQAADDSAMRRGTGREARRCRRTSGSVGTDAGQGRWREPAAQQIGAPRLRTDPPPEHD